jgi:type I restriction enzyme S subunit
MQWAQVPLHALLQVAGSGIWGREPGGPDPTYLVLRSTNIQDGRFRFDDVALRGVAAKTAEKYSLCNGDILVTTSSGSAQLLGKNAIVESLPTGSGPYLFSNFTWRLRPTPTLVHPKFLYFYLNSATARAELQRIQSTTSGLRNLNTALYLNQPVPLPPLSEQRRIVEILDQADHLRRLRAEADAKANRILTALFIKMFGDPETNPMGWPVRTLGELATLGPEYGANARAIPLSSGQPRYVRITDIDDDGRLRPLGVVGIDLDDWEQYKLERGDLLFARSGATVGKTYLHRSANSPCVFAGYLIRFRLDPAKIHPLVAFAFTQTMSYRAWVGAKRRTAAQPNINGQEYASLRLPVPARSAQEHFASLCSSIEMVGHASLSSSGRLESLFSVLCRRAFDGDLTASWREAHIEELFQEMEHQAKILATTARPE